MRIWALSIFAGLLLFLSHADADNVPQRSESVAPQPVDAPIHRRNSGIVRNPKRIRAVMNGLKIAPNFRSRRIRESKDLRREEISPYRFVVINKTQLDRERNFYLSGYRIDKHGDLGVYYAPLQLINWVQKKNTNVNPEEVLESLPPLKMDIVPPIPYAIQQQLNEKASEYARGAQQETTSVPHKRKQRRRPAASAVKSAVNQEAKILDDILMSLGQSFAQAVQMKKPHKKHIKSQDYPHLKRFESEPNKENFGGDPKKFSTDAQNHVVVRANTLNPDEFLSVKEAHQPKIGPLQSKVEELDEAVTDKYEFAKVRQNVNDASTVLPIGIPPPPPPLDSEVWAERKQKALVRPMITLVTSENNNDSVKIPFATADPLTPNPATSESRQKSPMVALVSLKDGENQGFHDVEDISMPNFMESSTDIKMVTATTLPTTTEYTTPRILANDDYAEEERLLAAGVTSRFGERPEDDFDDITTVAFTTQTATSTPTTTTKRTTPTTTSETTTSTTTMTTTASTTAKTTRSTSVSALAPQQEMVIVPMEMSALSHSLTLSQSRVAPRSPSLSTKFNLLDEIQEEIAILDGRKGEGDVRNMHIFSSTTRRTTPTTLSTTTQKSTSRATTPTTTTKSRQTISTSATASTTSASKTTSIETTTTPTTSPIKDETSSQPTDVTAPILVSSSVSLATAQPEVVPITPVSFAIAPDTGSGIKDISGVELIVTTEETPTTETPRKMEELEESVEIVHPTLIPDSVVVQLLGGESNKETVEKIDTGSNSTETVLEGEETATESATFTTTPAVTTEQHRNSSQSKESSESSSGSQETRRHHHKHPRSRRNRNRSNRRDDSHSRSYSDSRSTSSDDSTMAGDIEMMDSREAPHGNNKIVSYPIQVQPRKKQLAQETPRATTSEESVSQGESEPSTVPVAKPVPTSSSTTTTTTTTTATTNQTTTSKHRYRHHSKRRRHHHRRRYSDSFDSDEDSYERPTTSRVKEEIKPIMTATPSSPTVIEHLMQPAKIDGESDSATVFVSTASKSEIAPNTEVDRAPVVKVEGSAELTTTASTQSAPTLVDAEAGRERVDSSKEETEELNNKKSAAEMKEDAEAEEKRIQDNEVARQIAEIIRKRRLREKVYQNSVEREVLVRGGSEPETDDLSEEKEFPRENPEEVTTDSPKEEEKTYLVRRTVKEVIPLPVARQVPEARLPSLVERFESQLPITSDSAGGFILQDVLLSHRNLPNANPIFIQNIKTNPETEQFQFVNDQFAPSLMGVPQMNLPRLIDTHSSTPISIRPPVARVPSLNTHRQRRRKPASTERVPAS